MGDLPRNLEAEEALIGSSLLIGDIVGSALKVEPGDFSSAWCANIWRAMLVLKNNGDPIDLVTVISTLENSWGTDELDALSRMTRLINNVPSSLHIEKYAELVLTESAKRRLALALPKLSKIAFGKIAQHPSDVFSLAISEIETASERTGVPERELWTAAELANLGIVDKPWLLEGLLVNGGLNLLAGETGAGKTYACLDLAVCMAGGGGIAWGRHLRSGSLIYFGADNARRDLQHRLNTLALGRGIQLPASGFLIDIDPIDLGSTQGFSTLVNAIRIHAPKLIIIDSLVRYMGSLDENNARDVARLMARFRKLSNINECTFLLVHHLTKRSGRQAWSTLMDRVRGSGDFVGAVDSALVLTSSGRLPNITRKMTHVKCRIANESNPLRFGIFGKNSNKVKLAFEESEAHVQRETLVDHCINLWVSALKTSPGKRFGTSDFNDILLENGVNPSQSTIKIARSALKRFKGVSCSKEGRKMEYWYENQSSGN